MRTFLASFVFTVLAFGQAPADLLRAGLSAMGGEEKIRNLTGIHFTASIQRNALEQSERPEGPYIVEAAETEEWRDLAHESWKSTSKLHVAMQPPYTLTATAAGGVVSPPVGDFLQQAEEALALSPERVLMLGLATPGLVRLPDLKLQAVPHHAVEFRWKGAPVRVFLNAETRLPTAVEWVRAYPYSGYWSIWGDVTTRVTYSFWWLQDGIHYPLQANVERNGLPDRTITITKIDYNPTFAADTFRVPQASPQAKMTADDRSPRDPGEKGEIAPGIVLVPGAWNTSIIRQSDGMVILEAPISSGYSAKLMELARKRFPGVPIKAVISTSDSWPHIGGVREYVAQGIPVYVLDRTVPLLERVLKAPRRAYPDTLAKTPRKADLRPVSGKVVIGSGPNRIELYPLHGETSERQMMAYFPEHKLLYGSDPFQQMPDGSLFYPQTVSEVRDAVEREHLTVERFFMMHIGVTPWSTITKETR